MDKRLDGQHVDNQPKHTVSAYEGDKLLVEEYFEDLARAEKFARVMAPVMANSGIVLLVDGKDIEGAQ